MSRIVALLLVLSVLSCDGDRDGRVASDTSALLLRRGPFRQELVLTGSLIASHQDEILVPRIPNWRTTIQWMAEPGTQVAAGDRVLELDNSSFVTERQEARLAVNSAASALLRARATARANLSEMEFNVERKRLELEKSRLDANIPENLRKATDHQEAQVQLERSEMEHQKAIADLSAGRAAATAEEANLLLDLEKARRKLATAEEGIDSLQLKATRAGIVLAADHPWEARKFKVRDTVFVGWTIVYLPDLSGMQIEATLSDVDDGKLVVGMPAVVTLDTYPAQEHVATVTQIASVASEIDRDSTRRAFRVVLDLATTDPEIMLPGMSVQVRVETFAQDDALLVPRAAIDFTTEPPQLVLSGGAVRAVELGPCSALECVVRDDLPDGTVLAATGRSR